MVLRSVLGSQAGSKVSIRGTQVPRYARPRALQFGSSLSISIKPSSSLNCGFFSTSIFFSNYIDFSKLQCPSVDFQLCTAKAWSVAPTWWEKQTRAPASYSIPLDLSRDKMETSELRTYENITVITKINRS